MHRTIALCLGLAGLCLSVAPLGCEQSAATDAEPSSASPAPTPTTPPDELEIRLPTAPGVKVGTLILARGIAISSVTQAQLAGPEVVLHAAVWPQHKLEITAESCARMVKRDGVASIELELGEGETVPLRTISACELSPIAWKLAEPQTDDPATPQPDSPAPSATPNTQPDKRAGSKAKPACGDELSFATLSVQPVDAQPLHLPDGGWRAKIRFKNDGDDFIQLEAVSTAAFMDTSGAALRVATLPASKDWFMPFELPPRSTKIVSVTFFADGGPKPWVQRMKYSWNCD